MKINKGLKYIQCRKVGLRYDWATTQGSASQMRPPNFTDWTFSFIVLTI